MKVVVTFVALGIVVVEELDVTFRAIVVVVVTFAVEVKFEMTLIGVVVEVTFPPREVVDV